MEVDGRRRDCCAGLITVGAAMVCNEEASGQPYALHWGGYYTEEHTTLRATERTSLGTAECMSLETAEHTSMGTVAGKTDNGK